MIIVTGAAGFIGSCLVRRLNEAGYNDVLVVDEFSRPDKMRNLEGKKIRGQVHRDVFIAWLEKKHADVDVLFHIGARTDTTELSTDIFDQLNVNYSKALWNLCAERQIPFYYASSAATYGLGESGYSDEHARIPDLKPLNPYGQSKQDFDLWVLAPPGPPMEGGSADSGKTQEHENQTKLRKGGQTAYQTADPAQYKRLKEFARNLRKNQTPAEQRLWKILQDRQLGAFKFRRQHIIDQFIADFVCLEKNLVIELDGSIHNLPENKTNDALRTEILHQLGFKVIRFQNEEVLYGTADVINRVLETLEAPAARPMEGGRGVTGPTVVNRQPLSGVGRQGPPPPLHGGAGGGFPWAGFKFFNVYGPNEYHKARMASVIFHTARQIKATGGMKLFRSHRPDFKDGEQSRDFIYVKDVVDVLLHFLEKKPPAAIYNLGTGKARTFLDLATNTFRSLDLEPNISFIDTPADIRDTYQYYTQADMTKLRTLAGYQAPFYSLEDGIDDYVKGYLKEERIW